MRKIILLLLIPIIAVYAQTATPPSAGDGSESNPYQIASLENLYWIAFDSTNWDKHYIQMANVNASACTEWIYTNEYYGWRPIGNLDNPFTGTYNGQYFKIDSLAIENTSSDDMFNQGLFGVVKNSEISNIGLTNTFIRIYDGEKIGSLVGSCDSSRIENCYCVGAIFGSKYVGGLVGYSSNSAINKCYVKDDDELKVNWGGVRAGNGGFAGGISGYSENSSMSNCYNDMDVYTNTIRSNPITTWNIDVEIDTSVNIEKCYSKQTSFCNAYYGLPGADNFCEWPDPYNDAWPIRLYENLRQKSEMKLPQTYLNAGWDFVNETENGTDDIWDIDTSGVINDGYPFLSWEYDVSSNFTYVEEIIQPVNFKLNQNYPNPFNPTTTLSFELPEQTNVQMMIFDITGRKINQWSYQNQSAGTYEITWNSKDRSGNPVPSGVYIYRMVAGDFVDSKKMVLLK